MRSCVADGTPAGLRAAHRRGARRPLHPLWFTDVLGQLEVVRHLAGRARERLRGGHALRRLGHRRLQPGAGERRARPARPQHASSSCPGPSDGEPVGPDVLRHRSTSTARPSRATPARCCAQPRPGPRAGLLLLRRPRDGVLLLRRRRPDDRRREPLDTGVVLRPHHRRRRQRPAQADDPHARGDGHPGRVLATTRTRRASTRSTCATPTP